MTKPLYEITIKAVILDDFPCYATGYWSSEGLEEIRLFWIKKDAWWRDFKGEELGEEWYVRMNITEGEWGRVNKKLEEAIKKLQEEEN